MQIEDQVHASSRRWVDFITKVVGFIADRRFLLRMRHTHWHEILYKEIHITSQRITEECCCYIYRDEGRDADRGRACPDVCERV